MGLCLFALIFQKNIEKVWDIEKICNIAKLGKNQGKNDRVPTFFYVKVFRWTRLLFLAELATLTVLTVVNLVTWFSIGIPFLRAIPIVLPLY